MLQNRTPSIPTYALPIYHKITGNRASKFSIFVSKLLHRYTENGNKFYSHRFTMHQPVTFWWTVSALLQFVTEITNFEQKPWYWFFKIGPHRFQHMLYRCNIASRATEVPNSLFSCRKSCTPTPKLDTYFTRILVYHTDQTHTPTIRHIDTQKQRPSLSLIKNYINRKCSQWTWL